MSSELRRSTSLSLARFLVGLFWWGLTIGTVLALLLMIAGLANQDDEARARGIGTWFDGPTVQVWSVPVPERMIYRDPRVVSPGGYWLSPEPYVLPQEGDGRVLNVELTDVTARFRVQPSFAFGLLAFGPSILFVLLTLWGVHQLRQLLRDVEEGLVFSASNAARLQRIGALIITAALAEPLVDWLQYGAILSAVETEGVRFEAGLPSLSLVLLGLVTLIVAEVWRYGVQLQADRDLTV